MNSFDMWTWVAIGVLVIGSLVVFGWFLIDVRGVLRGDAPAAPPPPPAPPSAAAPDAGSGDS